jgi:hypothetical protein
MQRWLLEGLCGRNCRQARRTRFFQIMLDSGVKTLVLGQWCCDIGNSITVVLAENSNFKWDNAVCWGVCMLLIQSIYFNRFNSINLIQSI